MTGGGAGVGWPGDSETSPSDDRHPGPGPRAGLGAGVGWPKRASAADRAAVRRSGSIVADGAESVSRAEAGRRDQQGPVGSPGQPDVREQRTPAEAFRRPDTTQIGQRPTALGRPIAAPDDDRADLKVTRAWRGARGSVGWPAIPPDEHPRPDRESERGERAVMGDRGTGSSSAGARWPVADNVTRSTLGSPVARS